jgi:hypothetical protein
MFQGTPFYRERGEKERAGSAVDGEVCAGAPRSCGIDAVRCGVLI